MPSKAQELREIEASIIEHNQLSERWSTSMYYKFVVDYVKEYRNFYSALTPYMSTLDTAVAYVGNVKVNMVNWSIAELSAANQTLKNNIAWAHNTVIPSITLMETSYNTLFEMPEFQAVADHALCDRLKKGFQGTVELYQGVIGMHNSLIEDSNHYLDCVNILKDTRQEQANRVLPTPSAPPAEAVEEDLPPPYREIDVQVPSPTILSRNGSRTPSPLARTASNSSSYQAPSLFAAAQSVDNNPWEYPADAYDKKQYRQFFVGYCGTHPDWVSQGKLPLIETSSHFARHWREACQKNNYTPAEIAKIVVIKPELELHRVPVRGDYHKDFIKQQNLNKFHIIPEMDEERFKNFTLPNKQRIKIFFDYDYSDDAISLKGTHKVYRPHPDLTPWQNAQLPLLAQACKFKIPADEKHLAEIVPVDLQHIFKQSLFKPPVQASVQPQANVKKRKPKACAIM